LHPFIAVAKGLLARGCEPVIATSGLHRGRVESQGIGFHSLGPDMAELENDPEVFRRGMDLKRGGEYVFKSLFMPHLRSMHDDLRAALAGADLLVAHHIVFAAPLVVASTGTPWLSAALAPVAFFSRHDPPVLPPAVWMRHLHVLGPRFWGPLLGLAKRTVRSWVEPVRQLRAELGLHAGGDPMFEDAFSPHGTLALFSRALGAPQPDWPAATVQTGFAYFDNPGDEGLSPALARFLDAGEPPIVFTLGSSAVMDAGRFYEESLLAARALGRRALLLIGRDPRNRPAPPLPDSALAVEYAPSSQLFPRAAAIVHQGGVGTTGQGLRSGRPTLVVPWSHDQPDNAHRVCKLGVSRTVSRARYSANTAAAELSKILGDPSYAARAEAVGREVRAEDGVAAACDAVERTLSKVGPKI
jgi:UDP:flavonoid glycosyltransferase YjiC (YdhE family)